MKQKAKKQQYVELGKMFYQIATFSFTGIVFAALFKPGELKDGLLGYWWTVLAGLTTFLFAMFGGIVVEFKNRDKEK